MNTSDLYDKLSSWIITTGPKILLALLILIAGEWIISLLKKRIQTHLSRKKINSTLRPFFQSLLIASLHVMLLLLVMQVSGIQLTIFAALIAAFGAAAAFALSGTLQNFASGIMILFLKPFVVGDNIIAQGKEGTVTSIQLFYTVIKTFDNTVVILPNSKLSNEVIINVTREGKRRLDIIFKVNFGIDFPVVKNSLLAAVEAFQKLVNNTIEPDTRIGINSVENDGYTCFLNIWVPAHGFQDAKLMLNEKVVEHLKNSGLKLPGV